MKTFLYAKSYGNGTPLLNLDGSWNDANLAAAAKFDVCVFDAEPWSGHGIDLFGKLRALNPSITLLAWMAGCAPWLNPNPAKGPKEEDFPWNYWQAVDSLDGWIKNPDGSKWLGFGSAGTPDYRRFDVRNAITQVVARFIAGKWDGLFADLFPPRIRWLNPPWPQVEDSRWELGHAEMCKSLRKTMGPDAILIGNGGPGPNHQTARDCVNGWTRENFPAQNGGTWETNMLGYAGQPGYLTQGMRAPQMNVISIMPNWSDPVDDERRANFAVCSALLGDGVATIVGEATGDKLRSFRPIRYPIYSDMGLGAPRTTAQPARKGLWMREYEGGTVVVNPSPLTVKLYGATFAPSSGTIL